MGKFIDRQKLEAHFSPAITGKEAYTAGEVLLSIQKFPSADVVPVVHAHWIANSRYCEYTCSHCGDGWRGDFDLDPFDDHFYYCPNCGAKMDEEMSNGK